MYKDNINDPKIQDFIQQSILDLSKKEQSLKDELSKTASTLEYFLSLKQKQQPILENKNLSLSINESNEVIKRSLVKPDIADDNILNILNSCSDKQGMTNPEIERYLIQNKEITISRNGIKASLERLIEKNLVKITNPNQERHIRYIATEVA